MTSAMIMGNEVLERMTQTMGGPPTTWVARCHAASIALVEVLGPDVATVRRGYFIGNTKPGAYFHGRPSQHSWVELRDGRVADPTRFAFVGGPEWPIWVGPDDEYDVGGCKLAAPAGAPPGPFEADTEVDMDIDCSEYVADLLGLPSEFYGPDYVSLNVPQVYWLAHLPIKNREGRGILCRFFAAEVYEAIIDAGYSALIPIDRLDWILPERSKGRSSF